MKTPIFYLILFILVAVPVKSSKLLSIIEIKVCGLYSSSLEVWYGQEGKTLLCTVYIGHISLTQSTFQKASGSAYV